MTAAHKTLPMNTIVRVTNRRNGLSAVVRINDRGPFVNSRIIDLSNAAARKIKMVGTGTAPVLLEVLGFKNKKRFFKHKVAQKKKELTKEITKSNFALQIASFSKISGALSTQEKYDNTDGYKTIIKDESSIGKPVFKVLLKGFKSEKEVRDYKKNGQFKHSFIVRED